MLHHVARTRDRRLAWSTWQEGVRLFHTVVQAAPGRLALCVMPDHVHVLCPADVRARLGAALGGYARWRNSRRGERGALWERLPEPDAVEGVLKIRRNIRYIHLNPCRGGLVADPLAWPLCTHLDAVGLVLDGVRRRASDGVQLHRYVSSDPSVGVQGTDLPCAATSAPAVEDVLDAVSLVTRTPLSRVGDVPVSRDLAVRALRVLTPMSRVQIAQRVGCSRSTVARVPVRATPAVRLVERWVGDPRCTPLDDGLLRSMLQRSRYRRLAG